MGSGHQKASASPAKGEAPKEPQTAAVVRQRAGYWSRIFVMNFASTPWIRIETSFETGTPV